MMEAHRTEGRDQMKVCEYSVKHKAQGVPAETEIDCGPVGKIPACRKCADFYKRNR